MSLLESTANRGAAEFFLDQLRDRFQELPEDTVRTVRGASRGDLRRWGSQFAGAATLDDVFR